MAETTKERFQVSTYSYEDGKAYVKWSKGLRMIITKGNNTIELDEHEVIQLVNTLPKTVGGRY